MSAPAQPAPAALIRVPAGTTAGAAVREAGLPGRGEPEAVVVVADADGKLRDLSWTPDVDAEVRPVAARHRRGSQRHPALGGPRAGPGGAGHVPGRQAGHRPADHRRLLLRLRRRRAVHPGEPPGAREADAPDRQGRSAVLPAGLRVQGRGPRRTGRRALQARTGRRQVRRPRRDGGRRRRAHRLRQPQSPYPGTGLGRPVPRPAHPDHPLHPGVHADPQFGGVLARRSEQRQPAAHLRHRLGVTGGPRPAPAS